ncbi:MAG: hypothetical protein ACK53L_17550, partial [Pirellulaceae bacterium]
GNRAREEPVPRLASYVYAPADPLLIQYARSWSLSEPYLLSCRQASLPGPGPGLAAPGAHPLQAIDERAGSLLRVRGPELPHFLPGFSTQHSLAQ